MQKSGTFQHGHLEFSNQMALVVDENDVLRNVLLDQLQAWGMNVHAFTSKEDALVAMHREASGKTPYRIAVIDQQIKNANGFELAREIKADPDLSQTSVIMLQSFYDTNEKPENIETNTVVDKFVQKPLFGSDLFNAILAVLTGHEESPSHDEK